MSDEGLINCIPGHEAWGFSVGTFPVHCIDCPKDQLDENKILGSVSSYRCLYHAIKARCANQDEGCSMSFYEPEPFDFPTCSWDEIAVEVGSILMLFCIGFLSGASIKWVGSHLAD